MLKDARGDDIREGSVVVFVPQQATMSDMIVTNISAPMVERTPQGNIPFVVMRGMAEFVFKVPANTMLPGMVIIDKADTERAKDAVAKLQKIISEIDSNSTGSSIVLTQ